MYRLLWKIHSLGGLFAGVGLIVIGLTGSLLVFNEPLEKALHPELIVVTPTPAGRLPSKTLLENVRRELPDHVATGWLTRRDSDCADFLYVTPVGGTAMKLIALDPYSGKILATPRETTSTVRGFLIELHYALMMGHTGVFIAGLLAFALLGLGITGLFIYRKFWKHLFRLRLKAASRIFFSDLHKAVGIGFVAFNLILGFTGAYWNLTHILGDLIAEEPPETAMLRRDGPVPDIDAMRNAAAGAIPGFVTNYVAMPTPDDVTLYGRSEPFRALESDYGSHVGFDAKTGAIKETAAVREAGVWARILDTFAPLHYGTFGGLPIRILWCLGGLTPGILAVTGYILWWKRRRPKARRPDPIN